MKFWEFLGMLPNQKWQNRIENLPEKRTLTVSARQKIKLMLKKSSCKLPLRMKFSKMTSHVKNTIICWIIRKKCIVIITDITGAGLLQKWMLELSLLLRSQLFREYNIILRGAITKML